MGNIIIGVVIALATGYGIYDAVRRKGDCSSCSNSNCGCNGGCPHSQE